jgi:hypothetical protein
MSRRSKAAYYAQVERPIAWCHGEGCRNRNARTGKDGQQLCKDCRAKLKKPSYRIHKNVWDNWYGYEGTRRVVAFTNTPFATAEDNAKEWLKAKLEGK